MKYVELKPLTNEQLLKKAEEAWSYYDKYWTPSFDGEVKDAHDEAIAKWIENHFACVKNEKTAVESVDIFDEIIENATDEEIAYCRGSKVIAKIKDTYNAALLKAKEDGNKELCKQLFAAERYAENLVRHLAKGNVLPTSEPASEADAEAAFEKCASAWGAYPSHVIMAAQQIAEDMLANDDDGIIMVDPMLIADEIMKKYNMGR